MADHKAALSYFIHVELVIIATDNMAVAPNATSSQPAS